MKSFSVNILRCLILWPAHWRWMRVSVPRTPQIRTISFCWTSNWPRMLWMKRCLFGDHFWFYNKANWINSCSLLIPCCLDITTGCWTTRYDSGIVGSSVGYLRECFVYCWFALSWPASPLALPSGTLSRRKIKYFLLQRLLCYILTETDCHANLRLFVMTNAKIY